MKMLSSQLMASMEQECKASIVLQTKTADRTQSIREGDSGRVFLSTALIHRKGY